MVNDMRVEVVMLAVLTVLFFVPVAQGEPENFAIYSDESTMVPFTSLDWGTFDVGGTKTKFVYVENFNANPLSELSYRIENVYPEEATKYLILSDGQVLDVRTGERERVPISLTVSQDVNGFSSFSFDLVVTASFSEPLDVNDVNDVNVNNDDNVFEEGPTGGGGGGGGSRVIEEDETVLPSSEPLLSDNQKTILILVIVVLVYLEFGGKRR